MDAVKKDGRPLDDVIQEYEEQGATTRFISRPMHLIECQACGEEVTADPAIVLDIRRVVGDGDDATIALIECPACVAQGILPLGSGDAMPEEHATVLDALLNGSEEALVDPL